MLNKNNISILRNVQQAIELDYCLQFTGNGYINIEALYPYFDLKKDFSFTMEFKVEAVPEVGFAILMSTVFSIETNAVAIAIDRFNIYATFFTAEGPVELYLNFTDTTSWHTISVIASRGSFSASLDGSALTLNEEASVSIPFPLGFHIASNTENSQNFTGLIDNILVTDGRDPIAQYLLNEGQGNTALDLIGNNDGSILNGVWQSKS